MKDDFFARSGLSKWPAHPFLFALLPVLSLLASNLQYIPPGDAWRAALLALVLTGMVIVSLFALMRNWKKACLVATPIVLTLLSYGHLYVGLKGIAGALIVRHRYLVPGLLLILSGWGWFVDKKLDSPRILTGVLNVSALLATLPALIAILGHRVGAAPATKASGAELKRAAEVGIERSGRPDIFYFIVDGYGRQDVLNDLYGFDNTEFLDRLSDLGFQIAQQSATNYNQTMLTVASVLNLDYLQNLVHAQGQTLTDEWMGKLIRHSVVRDHMAQFGYRFVAFDSGFPYTTIPDADVFFQVPNYAEPGLTARSGLGVNALEALLVQTSAGKALLDWDSGLRESIQAQLFEPLFGQHRSRVLFTLEQASRIPELEGDFFVFAHVVSPHPPFVFGPNGEPRNPGYAFSFADGSHYLRYDFGTREEYIRQYTDQLKFLNSVLADVLTTILSKSTTDPIIIVQADHGPGAYHVWESIENSNVAERSGILNALYLPGAPPGLAYPTISPVNTFRLIFDRYFDQDFTLLDDCTYFSSTGDRYAFAAVAECRAPGGPKPLDE